MTYPKTQPKGDRRRARGRRLVLSLLLLSQAARCESAGDDGGTIFAPATTNDADDATGIVVGGVGRRERARGQRKKRRKEPRFRRNARGRRKMRGSGRGGAAGATKTTSARRRGDGRSLVAASFEWTSPGTISDAPEDEFTTHEGVRYLTNADFEHGTLIIDQSGTYKLSEDITFGPNSVRHIGPEDLTPGDVVGCCKPLPHQFATEGGPYRDDAYQLGFFAAIAVTAPDVTLDLNGHTLEQSAEHALMQRFYANVETCGAPFIPGQGPADFGEGGIDECASNLVIRNGVIGRSSHHGVHGNGNKNVLIEGVVFREFEVAAVHLNGVDGLEIRDCAATGSRTDVPVLGTFSSSKFIHPILEGLDESGSTTTLTVGGVTMSVSDVRRDLEDAMFNVYSDVIFGNGFIDNAKHPKEYGIYHNKHKVIEANAYGFVTNHMGVAVNGFPNIHNPSDEKSPVPSRNVKFERVSVSKLRAAVLEIVALTQDGKEGKPIHDEVGAVIQVRNVHPDTGEPCTVSALDEQDSGTYVGNPAANAQLFVAKAQHAGEIESKRNTISENVVAWAESGRPLSELLRALAPPAGSGEGGEGKITSYVCNGDSMGHVNKGVIGFKIDGTEEVSMVKCEVNDLVNLGGAGSTVCGNYAEDYSIAGATSTGYNGANARGYSFAGTVDAQIRRCAVRGVSSLGGGMAIGFDVHTTSKHVRMYRCGERDITSTGIWNNLCPSDAMGVRMGSDTKFNKVYGPCLENPHAPNGLAEKLMDEGRRNKVVKLSGGCPFMNAR